MTLTHADASRTGPAVSLLLAFASLQRSPSLETAPSRPGNSL